MTGLSGGNPNLRSIQKVFEPAFESYFYPIGTQIVEQEQWAFSSGFADINSANFKAMAMDRA